MYEALSTELEAALVRELQHRFEMENRLRFAGELGAPVFALVDSETKLGRWIRGGRRIEISRTFVLNRPWLEVTAVLQHEMAHQYVDEVLETRDELPHGETFRRVCVERGIDARAAGTPGGSGPNDDDRMLDRIRKLLALAGSDNRNEAELAMQKAHELMLRHNIDAASTDRRYRVRQIGTTEKRMSRVEGAVLGLLAEFFFVKVICIPVYLPRHGARGTAFEITGTAANVDMAEHVYAFLLATAERLWLENRRDYRVRSGRDRIAYQDGVIAGFRAKLLLERLKLTGTGLVWVGDSDLDQYYRARHPRIVTRRQRMSIGGAHMAGREAGHKVVLHKPVANTENSGRVLGHGRTD